MDRNFDPYKRTVFQRPPLPRHFPQQGSMDGSIQMEEVTPGPSIENFNPNRIASMHRPMRTNNFGQSYVDKNGFEKHANRIVEKLEKDDDLMEDTPISEQLRQEALRDLPQCLTIKRCVRAKLSKSVSLKSKRKTISWSKSLKYRFSVTVSKFKANIENFGGFELWYGTLKNIEGHFGSSYASYFKFLRWLFVMNLIVAFAAFCLIVVPQICFDLSINGANDGDAFQFKDIFTGGGSFRNTVLYYGHYTDKIFAVVPNLYFNMPAAYFSVTLILYLIPFLVMSISVAGSYRRSFIETEGGLENVFANKVFCAWDYGIATKRAADLKSDAIFHELKELLNECLEIKNDQSFMHKFYTWTIQVVVNLLILVLLSGTGYGLWLLLEEFGTKVDESVLTTSVANFIMMLFPIIFTAISKYEDYKNPRVALYITLTRTFLLGLVVVGVILTFWLSKADVTVCWETLLGEEIYRLIIFDFIISVIFTTIFEVSVFLITRFKGNESVSEFNIARHTLQIIYNQALFWVGFLFSPLLPVVVVLKMLVIWYVRSIGVKRLCVPPSKSWRAAQTHTYFLMITFITMMLVIAMMGYIVTSIKTSNCGPFSHYDYIYEMITGGVDDFGNSNVFGKIVVYLTKPWVVVLLLVALGIWVYYFKEKAEAQRGRVKLLRELLIWEAKDKEFLLQHIDRTTNGKFKYHLLDGRSVDAINASPFDDNDLPNNNSSRASVPTVSQRSSQIEEDFSRRFKKYA